MSLEELLEIVDRGADALDFQVDPAARQTIAERSEGLPHFTHQLSLYAFQRAVMDDRDHVTTTDVQEATKTSVSKAQPHRAGAAFG
jgi:Holliday junction resolvasome RuvABC ATP-dependent DNA helicase subunit